MKQKSIILSVAVIILTALVYACATTTTIAKSVNAKDFPPGVQIYITVADNIHLKDIPELKNNYSEQEIKEALISEIKSTVELLHGTVIDQLPANCDNCYQITVTAVNIASGVSTKKHTDAEKGYTDYPYPYYTSTATFEAVFTKTDTQDKIGNKTFYAHSYSRLKTQKLPPAAQLDDINKYIAMPKYDFKGLTRENAERIAYWSSKKLNKYLEKQNK